MNIYFKVSKFFFIRIILLFLFSHVLWGIDKPIANAIYQPNYYLTDTITLDTSVCSARSNFQIKEYLWSQADGNPQKVCPCVFKNKSKPVFRVYYPGTYHFFLIIDDGIQSDPFPITLNVINKYAVIQKTNINLILTLSTNQRYETIYTPEKNEVLSVELMKNDAIVIKSPIILKMKKGKSYLFSFNEKENKFIYKLYKKK